MSTSLKRVFIFPYNSVILADLVKRCGHQPLTVMDQVKERMEEAADSSPPYNVTSDDAVNGLEYCTAEVPSGVRGRIAVLAPLVEQAEAAIFALNPRYSFGSSGCNRANETIRHMVAMRNIPTLALEFPRSMEETREFVESIMNFLTHLEE